MSTERVEIKPDNTNESLEQSAEKLKNDGIDVSKDNAVNSDGTSVKVVDNPKEGTSTEDKTERPEWLPEKFQNAQELAKAYGELEKQFSSRPKEEVKEDVKIPEKATEPQANSLDKFYNEYAEKGSLSEESYQDLAKQGLDKTLVDGYIEGQKALADNHTKAIHDTVGGKERYADLMDWASKNLTEGEQTAFNNMVDGGSMDEAKLAVQGLMTKAGVTVNPNQPSLFEGTSDVTPNDAYESVSQVTDAMNDPRYEKDPAYRKKVVDKLARSTVI